MPTRAEQAQSAQEFIRSGAGIVTRESTEFQRWMNAVDSLGLAVSPEVAKALKQCEKILADASNKLIGVASELEPYTLQVNPGSYATFE